PTTLILQTDGKLLVGTSAHLMRLRANGDVDESFADPDVDGWAGAVAVQSDGEVLLGGEFSMVDGLERRRLARLSLPDAAVQSPDVSGNSVRWLRAGTTPDFAAAPVLYASFDDVHYGAIGPMTRITGGWRREGVSMP